MDEDTDSNSLNITIAAEVGKKLLEEAGDYIKKINVFQASEEEKAYEIKSLNDTITDLKLHKSRLDHQIQEACNLNNNLLRDLNQTKSQLNIFTNGNRSYELLSEKYRTSVLELELLKEEIQKRDLIESQLKKEIKKLERMKLYNRLTENKSENINDTDTDNTTGNMSTGDCDSVHTESVNGNVRSMSSPIDSPEAERPSSSLIRRSTEGSNALNQLQRQLEEIEIQLEKKQDHIDELEIQCNRMNNMIKTLMQRNSELEIDKENDIIKKNQKKELKMKQMEEKEANSNITRIGLIPISIAAEIENHIQSHYVNSDFKSSTGTEITPSSSNTSNINNSASVNDSNSISSSSSVSSSSSFSVPSPSLSSVSSLTQSSSSFSMSSYQHNEEYFYMTLQAIKVQFSVNHKLPYSTERVSEKVYLIKPSSLFEQVLIEKVAFHEWHTWIKKELRKRISELIRLEDIQYPNINMKYFPSPINKKKSSSSIIRTNSNAVVNVNMNGNSTISNNFSNGIDKNTGKVISVCKNFQPQFWKKNVCKDCLHTKIEHHQFLLNMRLSSRSSSLVNVSLS